GLYRIRSLGKPGAAKRASLVPLSSGYDELREASLATLRRGLGSRGILAAARAALEGRPTAEWADSIESEPDARIRAQLELSLARVGSPERMGELLDALAERVIEPEDLAETQLALRTLELALLRAAPVASEVRARLAQRLLAVFPCGQLELDRQLGILLASLPEAEERFVPHALSMLARSGIDAEGFHWAFVLRHATGGWTPARRAQYFEWLRAADFGFGGGREVPMFLAALRKDAVATLSETERAALGALVLAGVDAGQAPASSRAFVRAWSAAELEPELARLEQGRDLVRGERLLGEASCLTCHRIEGRGLAVGPELDGLAGRFGAEDLLLSLLDPSREVPDRFRDTEIRTVGGRLLVGKIVGGDAEVVLLRESYGTRGVVRIPRAEIESQELSRTSPMPAGLLDSLALEEVLDLLAFLLQDG
ncbi:MAG: c-type cytochrome, partial [Planctomycetes bacterium]|nr:c-type cytochrome [Planctomycetota bacterium]